MIRVMLVDDHRIVREGVRRVLEVQPDIRIVGEAARGEDALAALENLECDVLVMDLAMPGIHGREFVERIRRICPNLGLVVFSMYPEDPFALYFLRCGVNAFVTKERDPSDLIDAIRIAAQGKCFLPERMGSNPAAMHSGSAPLHDLPGIRLSELSPPSATNDAVPRLDCPDESPSPTSMGKPLLHLGPVVIDMESGTVQRPSGTSLLSAHELALLAHLAQRPGQTISRDDVLRDVWGYSSRAQTRTVEMTISRLRRKIEMDATNPRFILTIHGEGYRLELDRPGV